MRGFFAELGANRIIYVVGLAAAFIHFFGFSFSLLLPSVLKKASIPEAEIGLIMGLMVIPVLTVTPLVSRLTDRLGERMVLALGSSLVVLSFLPLAIAPGLLKLAYVARLLQGLAHALFIASSFILATRILPANRRAEGIGYLAVMIQLGNMAGVFVAEHVFNSLPQAWLFLLPCLAASISVILNAPAFEFSSVMPRQGRRSSHVSNMPRLIDAITIHHIPNYLVMIALGAAFGTTLHFTVIYFNHLSARGKLMEPVSGSFFIATALLSVAIVRLLGGRIADRVRKHMLVIGILPLMAAGLALMPRISGSLEAGAIAALYGASYGLLYPTVSADLIERTDGALHARASGLLVTCFDSAYAGIPLLVGPLIEWWGYDAMFYLAAAYILLACIVYAGLTRTAKRPRGPESKAGA